MTLNSTRLKLGGLAAATIMGVTATVLPLSLTWVDRAREDRQLVQDRLMALRRVYELLVDAETGQRGYVITGKDAFLRPYYAAFAALPAETDTLKRLYAGDHQAERQLVKDLLAAAEQRLAGLTQTVRLRQSSGFAAVEPLISSGQGMRDMDVFRRVAAELGAMEAKELADLEEELRSKIWRAVGFSLVSTVLTLGLLGYLAAMMARAIRTGQRSAAQAQSTSELLEIGMAALRQRNDEVSTLGEMSRVLQTEMTLIEALEVTSLFCIRLLPKTSGAIYLFRNSADLLELASGWGDESRAAPTMEPTHCWGLRRGQIHRSSDANDLTCRHCDDMGVAATSRQHACLPLIAYGDVLGLMHLSVAVDDDASRARDAMDKAVTMARTISEQVALSLSNAKLRQVLRDQSIKDPLTGLYNRRFMEEILSKEMVRAQRNGVPLSMVVADLDHFKKINDSHGHQAGDAVLRAAARHIASMIRGSDVACRYGGEEFVLILPDCSKADAVLKAQSICDALRGLSLTENGCAIAVTASFGVATTPMDGHEAGSLFEAADRAVYMAKHTGRDRVVVAGVTNGPDASRTAA